MKINDCFMYYDEDQLLDLRLNILNNYVDKFIIVESKFTHSGKIKNRNFQIDKFKKFKDKIEYIYIEEEPKNLKIIDEKDSEKEKNNKNIYNGLLRDNFQRNCLNNCIQKLDNDDVIILSDLDEIPNLEKINFEKVGGNIYKTVMVRK